MDSSASPRFTFKRPGDDCHSSIIVISLEGVIRCILVDGASFDASIFRLAID